MAGRFPPTADGLIGFYNFMFSDRKITMPPHLIPVAKALMDDRINKLLVTIGPGSGKAVSTETKVLTRDRGWAPIGDSYVGQQIMSPNGQTWTTIRAVMPQPHDYLYKMVFADGRVIRAHRNHLWLCYNKKFLLTKNRNMKWRLRTTEEIFNYHEADSKSPLRWFVPLCWPVQMPEAELPIDPYMLGCILGDAHISEKGYCTLTSPDQELVDTLRGIAEAEGNVVTKLVAKLGYGVQGLGPRMRDLGLDGKLSETKFVPDIYKSASIEQRYEIIRGLMDTDGTVSVPGKTPMYCTVSPQLASDFVYLIRSVGGMASISTKDAWHTYKGERRQGQLAYVISIRHQHPKMLFKLSRKRDLTGDTQYSDDLKLEIMSMTQEAIATPSVCINVDEPSGLFLAENFVVTHNSMLLSTLYPAFTIGHDPTTTILGISAGEALMQGFQRSVMDWVQDSPRYHAAFPGVLPDKNAGWSSERGMFVTGRSSGNPDANYAAFGLSSSKLTGVHARRIIIDDIHNQDTAKTSEQCLKVREIYYNTIVGRADPQGCRFVAAGRRWHQDDVYGHFADSGEWVHMNLPAQREGRQLFWDVTVPEGLHCVFTDAGSDAVLVA